jgi:isoleucyl-tRNA synthetase
MSKSRRNYPDVGQVFSRDGSDAMRWFLMSSPILRGADLVVTEAGIRESVRQAVLPLWNAWYFLALYARASDRVGTWRTDSADVLDRYVLSKTAELVDDVTDAMDVYDLAGACASVRLYLEGLTNWYIRRSRSGIPTTRRTREPTSTARWTRSNVTSASGPTTCTAPTSTS